MILFMICAILIIGVTLALSCANFAQAFIRKEFKVTRALLGLFWSLLTAATLVFTTYHLIENFYSDNIIMEVNTND